MTIDEVRKRIAEIEASKHDDEGAHALEDALYSDYIRFKAKEGDEIAQLLLTTAQLDFCRWCA